MASNEFRGNVSKVSEAEYGSKYRDHIVDIYKMYVDMADRVSARRGIANSFYLTASTSILAICAFFRPNSSDLASIAVCCIAGIFVCVMWWRGVSSYKTLNDGKFEVIHEIEKTLPIAPYESEWRVLKGGKKHSQYRPFYVTEMWMPKLIGCLFVVLLAFSIYKFLSV